MKNTLVSRLKRGEGAKCVGNRLNRLKIRKGNERQKKKPGEE